MSKGKKMQESLALVTVFLIERVQWLLCLLFLEIESRSALIAMFAMYWGHWSGHTLTKVEKKSHWEEET